jgi:hypothetical protein
MTNHSKICFSVLFAALLSWSSISGALAQEPAPQQETNPFINFLKTIDYTTRIAVQHDDNIFLAEDGEDSDFKQIFTQAFEYNRPQGDHFWRGVYVADYEFYDNESEGILSHTVEALYSYRPLTNFSFGAGNRFYWLEDSAITAPLGDRLLAVGYTVINPYFQTKYEVNPQLTLETDLQYSKLDVRGASIDDYIDNERLVVRGQANYGFTPKKDFVGFIGFEHDRMTFPQIFEKSQTSARPFLGFIKKFPGFFHMTYEVGFDHIKMDDNADDTNIDQRISFETVFSIFTKFHLDFIYNAKTPSLRRDYTQYGSTIASVGVDHTINPKTSVALDYSYEFQDFNDPDALIGQPLVDRETQIQDVNFAFNRKLNQWLTFNLRYDYTKRDTDFAAEGYTNNQYTAGLTARY